MPGEGWKRGSSDRDRSDINVEEVELRRVNHPPSANYNHDSDDTWKAYILQMLVPGRGWKHGSSDEEHSDINVEDSDNDMDL